MRTRTRRYGEMWFVLETSGSTFFSDHAVLYRQNWKRQQRETKEKSGLLLSFLPQTKGTLRGMTKLKMDVLIIVPQQVIFTTKLHAD